MRRDEVFIQWSDSWWLDLVEFEPYPHPASLRADVRELLRSATRIDQTKPWPDTSRALQLSTEQASVLAGWLEHVMERSDAPACSKDALQALKLAIQSS